MLVHDFWLLRESEYSYKDHTSFWARKDAPVRISEDFLRYIVDTISWVPTYNPAMDGIPAGNGLNWYGPTIINQSGGILFHQICLAWSQLLSLGPEKLRLQGTFEWTWPFNEEQHTMNWDQLSTIGHYERLTIDRDESVQILTTLSRFGEQAATGTFFILHIGI